MDSLKEEISKWDRERCAAHLEGEAAAYKVNSHITATKTTVYALERAAELLREKKKLFG